MYSVDPSQFGCHRNDDGHWTGPMPLSKDVDERRRVRSAIFDAIARGEIFDGDYMRSYVQDDFVAAYEEPESVIPLKKE